MEQEREFLLSVRVKQDEDQSVMSRLKMDLQNPRVRRKNPIVFISYGEGELPGEL